MKPPTHLPAAFFPKDRDRVLVGLARMNHDRPLQLTREPDLRAKYHPLHVGRREVVVIVQTNLPDGPGRRRAGDLFPDDLDRAFGIAGELVGLVRVDAHGNTHLGPELLQASRLGNFFGIAGRKNDERALDASLTRARDDGVEIGGEYLVRQMTVGVAPEGFRVPGSRFKVLASG